MSVAEQAEYVTRNTILNLLSNDEIAKVSTAEATSGLTKGAEFLDLEHLDQGVQRAGSVTKVAMGQVLPRNAVSEETWGKILLQLAGLIKSVLPSEKSLWSAYRMQDWRVF